MHVVVFATALTSFIHFNTAVGSTEEQEVLLKASQSFHLDTSLSSTDRVYYNETPSSQKLALNTKIVRKSIPALLIGEKLLVIKGFSEESTSVLTALEEENVTLEEINTSGSGDVVPTTVEVSVSEEAGTTVLDQDGEISEYQVVAGDTVQGIANKFNITAETILWANDLKKTTPLKVGQKLAILPISGVSYVIRSGDTVSEISEKFHVSQKELTEFNDLQDGKLVVGDKIIIPGGKILSSSTPSKPTTSTKPALTTAIKGFFSRPVAGGTRTQGIHGHNGIDIAAAEGTPILAARDGYVSLVRGGNGWNGGYGNYVVITHEGGIQTLYAHMSSIDVLQGQNVKKGQKVGGMGNTGQSTGVHLHFEVRGAKNPF
ncbi:MAG: M23 family metallopeptidase [Patescibacteria group bacterium]